MMFYVPSYSHVDPHRRYHRARQHQIAVERERERRLRRQLALQREEERRRAIAVQRARERRLCEEEIRRRRKKQMHRRCQAPSQNVFSASLSDPFFSHFGFGGFDRHPLRSMQQRQYNEEDDEEDDHRQHQEDEEAIEQEDEHKDIEEEFEEEDSEEEPEKEAEEEQDEVESKREQDVMSNYMTERIRSMRRRRKSDSDFNPEALMNLAESELNWLMDHEALRCEENTMENYELTEQQKKDYRKLVLTFLRVYVCENILDSCSRDNFPPKPEASETNEMEDEDDSQQYYVLDVERRRKLHRLAARLEKEFE